MEDFNLRNYLYNNPLLEEEKKEEKPKGKKSKPKKSKEEDIKENKLRGYIRERITSILKEAETEEEDVDVDVDVEDTEDVDIDIEKEVDVEDEEIESDIEVKTSVPGESADEDAVLGLLTKAQEEAEKLGDPKLLDQIGNTITFFTRKHIVKSDETRGSSDIDEGVEDEDEDKDEPWKDLQRISTGQPLSKREYDEWF
jgi:hypothetical protein